MRRPPSALGAQVQTGTWFMNRCDYLDPALAWVGVKDSGRGCTLSVARLRAPDAAQIIPSAGERRERNSQGQLELSDERVGRPGPHR